MYIFDVFKDYAAEVRHHAIWSDSLMVCGGLLAAEACVHASAHWQRMLLLGAIYLGLFALYSKPDPPAVPPSDGGDVERTSRSASARERDAAAAAARR